ncbi:MAG TPA: hypothetical protein DCL54_08735 [Alphaproteobacteria bacterium]|nr:hypothetical protein [Alphaproteobacteria bacterium]
MKNLASILLFLFVANFVFAAIGPHCAIGTPAPAALSAAIHDGATHEHGDDHPNVPAKSPGKGEHCASMELATALSGVKIPGGPSIETKVVWAAAKFDTAVAPPSPSPLSGLPPPPLIAADFAMVHARTGRLLI